MYGWSRDSGFYQAPVAKVLLAWTSASSLLYRILSVRNSYPVVLWLLRGWAVSSAGVWLAMAMVLYSCRVLERRMGSHKFLTFLVSAGGGAVGVASLLHLTVVPVGLTLGAFVHGLVGALAVEYVTSVTPLYCKWLMGLPLSSNLVFYLLVLVFSLSSYESILATVFGVCGGVMVRWCGSLPLPHPPQWVVVAMATLVQHEKAPPTLSGATVEVQRQQRMDQIERMMMNMYQRRQRPVITVQRPRPPSEEQIQQLTAMGFPRSEVYQALLHTGSDVIAAAHLLTARNNAS